METEGSRFKRAREEKGLTLQKLEKLTGYSASTISGVENGHDRPSKRLRRMLIFFLELEEEWVRSGKGPMNKTPLAAMIEDHPDDADRKDAAFSAYFDIPPEAAQESEAVAPRAALVNELVAFALHGANQRPASELVERLIVLAKNEGATEARLQAVSVILEQLLTRLRKDEHDQGLTLISELVKSAEVKALVSTLMKRVEQLTAEPGSKAKLAAHLGVPPASLSQWLAGTREPGGENTLRLLRWCERQNRKGAA